MPPPPASEPDPAALRVLHYPAPVLRHRAEPVDPIDDRVLAVIERMFDLMREANGVGLAAPQVGLPWRLFVANHTGEPADDRAYINPTLRDPATATTVREEGCLSLPDITGQITRPAAITIDATDPQGRPFTLTADDLLARVWQHEYDHLDGVLILDRMPPIDRMANKKLLRELERAAK